MFVVNVCLAEMRFVRLSFLQRILSDQKRYITTDQVKTRNATNKMWEEYAVKNVWKLVKGDANFCSYISSEKWMKVAIPIETGFELWPLQ